MVGFAGWELPEGYGGAIEEHLAVRTRAGLFDLSHLGQVEVAGRDALAALQRLACNDASRLKIGETQRSVLTSAAGAVLDVVIVHRLGRSHYLLEVDAARVEADVAWIADQARALDDDAVVLDTSARYAGLALEGPVAEDVLQGLTSLAVGDLEPGAFMHGEVAGVRVTLARRSRTGENGFELLSAPQGAPRLWTSILQAGESDGVLPVGLAALETLRLEAGVRLVGIDIDEAMTPLEAGLGDLVAWEKGSFVGREALAAQRAGGVGRRSVGFEMIDPAVARRGCSVRVDGVVVGAVTSGADGPSVKKAIGLASLSASHAETGALVDVDVEGRAARARVVMLPFYHRQES
jgi:aminomethyltransferase